MDLKKGAVARVDVDKNAGVLLWLLTPKMVRSVYESVAALPRATLVGAYRVVRPAKAIFDSVSLGRDTRLITGWDHLIQPFDFSFSASVPASGAEFGERCSTSASGVGSSCS